MCPSGKRCRAGTTCDAYSDTCVIVPEKCGNGVNDPGEVCDDGNNISGDGCSMTCQSDETCGNSTVDIPTEACDEGPEDTAMCNANCQVAVCGDGHVNVVAEEECDEGKTPVPCDADGDGEIMAGEMCDEVIDSAACDKDCTLAECGDSHVNEAAGEVCDDGNKEAGDRCSAECRPEAMVAAGGEHTCVLLDTGKVRCWGLGSSGQLGYGNIDTIGDGENPSTAGDVSVGGAVIQLAAGDSYTCALLVGGTVRCWGSSDDGRLGNHRLKNPVGDDELPSSVREVAIGGTVIQLVAGSSHTCALLESGNVRCWGLNTDGQLGYGDTEVVGDDETPIVAGNVEVGGKVIQIAAGDFHTCALLEGGNVRCWGKGDSGRLGYSNTKTIGDDETPIVAGDINMGGTVIQLAASGSHTCALLEGGTVRCWGENTHGQLGYGDTANVGDDESPSHAGDISAVAGQVIRITAGASHTCALLEGGTVRCWGRGNYGQLGYGGTANVGDTQDSIPAGDVDVGGTVIQLDAGGSHTCALLEGGNVRCWGSGTNGKLGYGNTNNVGDAEGNTPAVAGDVTYQ